jgi:NADPH:quinone reductase-like Zn-dependent oxidoreductase
MAYQSWVFRSNQSAYDLKLEPVPDIPESQIPPDCVLIRVRAVALNYRDIIAWKNLAGRQVDGRVPTSDGAGEIVACGANVRQWKVGDRVAGCFFQTWQTEPFEMRHHKNDLGGTFNGMLQEFICLPESGIVRIPSHLDFEQAATLPCAALTAWYSLVCRGNLKSGQKVLCLGTGGVSIFALQIARAMGCEVIITSSDTDKLQRAKQLGAKHTINYRELPQWSGEVMRHTDEKGVDHVVEVGGPGTLEQSMKSVAAGGHIALIGVLTGFGAPATSLFPLLARNIRLNGIYVGPRDQFLQMNAFMEREQLVPVIDRVFEMPDAPDAFEYLSSGKHFGKVVVRI